MRKLLFISILLCSCDIKTTEQKVSDFVRSEAKPIIVKSAKGNYADGVSRDVTLISKGGGVLYIERTNICLPDTIK